VGVGSALAARAAIAAAAAAFSALPLVAHADGAKADGAKADGAKADGAKVDGARPDWARGLVIATGVGIADRHAPSAVSARGPARRAAEEAARKQLAAALPALPLAGGGTLAGKLGDAAVKARVDRAVAAALTLDADLSTDGSWKVTLAVPIEAVRQALAGPRPAPASDADGPPVVIVEGAKATPAVGYRLGKLAAPAVWIKEVPPWAKDAPRVKARGAGVGAIELADPKGSESTLFLILAPR
jgi:flagellar hook-length control protein FliK